MAITIHQQPDTHSAISTPLIVTASSTNSNNDGFKYVVRCYFPSSVNYNEFICAKNANGYLVFDAAPVYKCWMRNMNSIPEGTGGSVHSQFGEFAINFYEANPIINESPRGFVIATINILEGWNISGVFTIDEESLVIVNGDSTNIYNFLDFTTRDGFQPSLLATIGHEDGDQSRLMSDRKPTTYDWPAARFLGLSQPNAIYIPARESDWGVWSIRQSDSNVTALDAFKVRLSILPNTGAPVQLDIDLGLGLEYSHMALWPANLNASTLADVPKPSDYPNWKAIYFQILNDTDQQVSMTYVMFNVDHPQYGECSCHGYEVVRLAWVGRRGGWEYYNFNLLSETEYETDQKTAKKVVGNYGAVGAGTDFTFNSFDESEYVTYKKINKFVTCNTDILQPNEWEFLKGLILSKQVHWVHDDGTHTPVIIQDSNFKVRNPKSKAREALTVRFKVAQDQSN